MSGSPVPTHVVENIKKVIFAKNASALRGPSAALRRGNTTEKPIWVCLKTVKALSATPAYSKVRWVEEGKEDMPSLFL